MSRSVGTTDLDLQSSDLVDIGSQLSDTDTNEGSLACLGCSEFSSFDTL